MKVTAHTVKIATRAGIGRKTVDLTDDDLAKTEQRKTEQAARLARIAARRTEN